MKCKTKKILSLFLAIIMIASAAIPVFAASGSKQYKISNPYETVDFDTWGQYKAQLHTHTLYSDGEMDIKDVVEAYYALDYDILAVTDHGVVNKGWDKVPEMIDLIGYNQYIKNLTPLDAKRYKEITTGADRGGRGMLDVSAGIEMNALVLRKNHINGYFCGYGQSFLGKEEDYETPAAGTEAAGGISVINHPGDFFAANEDVARAYEPKNIKTFTDVFMKYESCVGIEAFNRIDTAARFDRIVWDNVLSYTVPRGRVVWGFANDDSHVETDIGLTAEMMLMPENTNENLRTAMENGTFYICSVHARAEMGEEFKGNGNYAKITNITADDENDAITITFTADELYTDKNAAAVIECVSDGVVIDSFTFDSKQESYTYTFDLNDNSENVGTYVRFQIKNDGGIVMTQPFVCDDGHMEDYITEYEKELDLGLIGNFIRGLIELFRKTLLGELIYKNLFM